MTEAPSSGAGRRAWLALAAVAAAGALLSWPLPAVWLDWQPGLAFSQPWRWWTAAWVHWSPGHLAANLGGTALVAALGWLAPVGPRAVWAWALAWPLTQGALLAQPALAHYGGLSGVLHAGVAAVAVSLLRQARGRRRQIGATLAAGLLLKIVLEAPWAGPLRQAPGWDIALAPLAHASGTLAGALAAAVLLALPPRHRPGETA